MSANHSRETVLCAPIIYLSIL